MEEHESTYANLIKQTMRQSVVYTGNTAQTGMMLYIYFRPQINPSLNPHHTINGSL
jgi:hypothetical protein